MPAFCIGTAAEGTKDWHLGGRPAACCLDDLALAVRPPSCRSRDFDVALSHAMKVDHGVTIPLYKLTGALARYTVLPVVHQLRGRPAALVPPRPRFRRGGRRIFWPATTCRITARRLRRPLATIRPRRGSTMSPPSVAQRLIVPSARRPRTSSTPARAASSTAARDLVAGRGPCLPPERAVGPRFPQKSLPRTAELENPSTP